MPAKKMISQHEIQRGDENDSGRSDCCRLGWGTIKVGLGINRSDQGKLITTSEIVAWTVVDLMRYSFIKRKSHKYSARIEMIVHPNLADNYINIQTYTNIQ